MADQIRIQREGTRVLVVKNGVLVADLEWQAALDLGRGLTQVAHRAEEYANAEQIIFDQAILTRAGAPFGLTNNPILLAEAGKEAAWNKYLRRYMPHGIQSKGIVGTPAICMTKPKGVI